MIKPQCHMNNIICECTGDSRRSRGAGSRPAVPASLAFFANQQSVDQVTQSRRLGTHGRPEDARVSLTPDQQQMPHLIGPWGELGMSGVASGSVAEHVAEPW